MKITTQISILIAFLYLVACQASTQNRGKETKDVNQQTFENPVLGGDYPDPSVIRVGSDFYMTHSSFEYYPGLLIWHSTDLVNWTRVGHALNYDLGSVWAPDLVYYQQLYYIYFPAGGTNWVVWATTPEGPWSTPIDLKLSGFIDPGHAVDAEGTRYLFLSKGYAVKLNADGLSTNGEPQLIYDGWEFPKSWSTECFCLESPKVTVKDGYFYLTVAEGGTAGPATSHMVVSARSKNPFGPYENSPYNPIIHTENRNEKWWSQGHGTLVDDIEGNWWIMYHGYEKNFHSLGRQCLMLPVEWTSDGWFKIPDGINSSQLIKVPAGKEMKKEIGLSDDFSSDELALQWQFLKNYQPNRIQLADSALYLTATGNSFGESSPLLVNASDRNYEVMVEFTIDKNTTAGLCLYYNEIANMRIAINAENCAVYIQKNRKISEANVIGNHGFLRILNDDNEISFYLSPDGNNWNRIERSLDATGYNHNVFGEFLSLRAGIFAFGDGQVKFDNFIYLKH